MVNKSLRILIADKEHVRRRNIERILNHIGYYCVAPAGSYEELVSLITPPVHLFDLLIVDSLLGAYEGINIDHFCQYNTRVYHSLIYGECNARPLGKSQYRYQTMQASLTQPPGFYELRELMAVIDQPVEKCAVCI